ncbi:MAG: hypothetical protein GY801_04250 [bacterium]|nr:hypothetical protein [bacterium]
MMKHLRNIVITILLVGWLQSSVLALTNEEVFSQFQFNFITPGARATALGGAFIGLADDATTVESNPAGLTTLTAPEVSIEFKHISYTTEQIYANPPTTGHFVDPFTIYETDITREEFDDIVETIPFVSVVYPYKQLVFSLYRQESVNYKSAYRTSAFPIGIPGTFYAFYPIDASVDLTVTNYGVGAAVQLFEGFSIAISPRLAEMKMQSHSTRFFPRDVVFLETDFSEADISNATRIDETDIGFSVNTGVVWKVHPKVSIGAVYRSGARFTVSETNFAKGTGGEVVGVTDPESDLAVFTLKVPDSFGVGIAFRATEFFTLALDLVHIRYKDLLKDFDIFNNPDNYTKENYTINNITEIHAGMEYILPFDKRLLALRAGVYHEPDHTLRFVGTTGDSVYDILGKEWFPGGDDQIHLTAGLGLVVNKYFQIDTAADIAEKKTQLSLSAVYRF